MIKNIKTMRKNVTDRAYVAPECSYVEIQIEQNVLNSSFVNELTGGDNELEW